MQKKEVKYSPFDWWRRRISLWLGPLIFLIILLLPFPALSLEAHRLAAIVLWVIVWWIGEPIPLPMTAILGVIVCVLLGITDIKTALSPFSDPVIFLFMGSFIIARSMTYHGLDHRLAQRVLSWRWVRKSPFRLLFMLGLTTAALSMWISNTATAAMMYPLALGLVTMLQQKNENFSSNLFSTSSSLAVALLLMVAYASSVGGIGTPVGTPPNLIAIAMLNKLVQIRISFLQWMLIAVPLLICMYLVIFACLYLLHKKGLTEIKSALRKSSALDVKRHTQRPWSKGEINTLIVFLITVILWLTPGFVFLFLGPESPLSPLLSNRIPEAAAALIGATLLFLLPVDWRKGEMTLTWKQVTEIDWGTLLLFGGGLSLGDLMFKTGLAAVLGDNLIQIAGTNSIWLLTFMGIYITNFLTETTSNTASATMIIPVMISVTTATGLNPLPVVLGCAFGASLAFTMPVSTPPNAIIYGSGLVPITKMIRTGFLLSLAGGLAIWLILRLLLPLYGLA